MLPLAEKYVNPLTDFGFKKLFGEEPNKDILTAFLNEVLPERHRIEELHYAKNEQLGLGQVDRRAVFDLYCRSESGERFIVELQKAKQNFFKDRSVFYSSFPIREQAQRGDWDFRLDAVYTVGILDFVFDDSEVDELIHVVELKDQQDRVFYDKLKYIYIELPKFTKTADELTTDIDKWLYVFRHLASLTDRPAALQERVFQKLFEVAKIANFSPQEQDAYEDSLKVYRDLNNIVNTSFEEGRQEGREQGARDRALAIARRLLAAGMSLPEVAATTGLSESELSELED